MAVDRKILLEQLSVLAPLSLAEPWDNVGILVDSRRSQFNRIFLTIDLDADVYAEARDWGADMIIAYHPPIFSGLKKIRYDSPQQSLVAQAITDDILIYSPHTALDAVDGGVNDWLSAGLGSHASKRPIQSKTGEFLKLVIFAPEKDVAALREGLSEIGCGVIGDYSQCAFESTGSGTFKGGDSSSPAVGKAGQLERVGEQRLEMRCDRALLSKAAAIIAANHSYEEPAWDAYALVSSPGSEFSTGAGTAASEGAGRLITFDKSRPLSKIVSDLKEFLNIPYLRVASPARDDAGEHPVKTVALCPGAGGSLFETLHHPDLYVTGEMRHHDVLQKLREGAAIILTEHTNCERGYLSIFAQKLMEGAKSDDGFDVKVSTVDVDPLRIW